MGSCLATKSNGSVIEKKGIKAPPQPQAGDASKMPQQANKSPPANVSDLDKEVFAQTNKLRTDPKSFIPYLEKRLGYFDGNVVLVPGADGGEFTQEGPAAVKEAIEFLKKAKPLKALQWSDGIAKACQDHVKDNGPRGLVGHDGSEGSTFWQRMERYGKAGGQQAENCSYAQSTGVDVVMQLVIDDNVPDRGHRKNLFKAEFAVTGNFSGPHSQYETMTCADFAESFTKPGEKMPSQPAASGQAGAAVGGQGIEAKVQQWMKEDVHFEMPEGYTGWNQSISCETTGNTATKTVTRNINLNGGKQTTLTVTESRTFN